MNDYPILYRPYRSDRPNKKIILLMMSSKKSISAIPDTSITHKDI